VYRQAALEAERARSVRVAALPPPPKDPVDSVELPKCKGMIIKQWI